MVRALRVEYPGAFYHGINRGNAGLGQSRKGAAKNYLDSVEKVDIPGLENPSKDISGGFILGGVDLGKYFGNICGAVVTVRYKNISEQSSRNRRLKGRVNRIKNKIVNY